jgi:hypothetical protein
MENKKFNLDDYKPERELFRVNERYFEELPVHLADRRHPAPARSGWWRARPALALGFSVLALVTAGLWFILTNPMNGNNEGTGTEGQPTAGLQTNDELYHILNHDEELGPTDDELIEQVARLEDQSEHKAIQEVLDETGYDQDGYLDEI